MQVQLTLLGRWSDEHICERNCLLLYLVLEELVVCVSRAKIMLCC